MGIRGSVDFSLFGGCTASAMGFSIPCSVAMPTTPLGLGRAAIAPLLLTLVSLILLLTGPLLGYTRKMSAKQAGWLLVIGGIAAILGPIALALTTTPQTLGGGAAGFMPGGGTPGTGFWGSIDTSSGGFGGRIDWGPGFGWYASLFAGICGFIAAFSAISGKPGPVVVPPTPPPGYYPVVYTPPYAAPYGQAGYAQPQYGQPQYAQQQYAQQQYAQQQYGQQQYAQAQQQQAQYGTSPYAPAGTYAPPPQAPQPPQQPQPRPTKNCPACGTLNWASSAFCGSCGAAMGT